MHTLCLFLQCTLFAASAVQDFSRQEPAHTPATYLNLQKTIQLLNRSLSSHSPSATSESIIIVVSTLAIFCCMNNDYRGAGAHLLGLQAMMRIRGGLGSLHNTIGLYIKRVDLHALNTGSTNFICTYPVGYSRFQYDLASFPASTPERYNELNLRGSVNPLLLTIFREMQYYARFTDYASHSNQRCTESEFFATIASFQDRLLQLPRTLDDDLSSCMCFTLLAYLTTMFHLPGRWDRHCYIAERLRSSCWSINIAHRPELSPLIRWVVVICAMSVFTAVVEETWMLQMWQTIGDSLTWEETKEQLERVMWSGAFQDAAGRIAFEHLNMGLKSTT